jgi:hypothetical protein
MQLDDKKNLTGQSKSQIPKKKKKTITIHPYLIMRG